jgi:hypothetical protein
MSGLIIGEFEIETFKSLMLKKPSLLVSYFKHSGYPETKKTVLIWIKFSLIVL